MLSVKELRTLASRLSADEFRRQLGPFVLVQKPPGDSSTGTDKMGVPMNVARTTVAKPEAMSSGALALLFGFDDLVVASVPPLQGIDELSVGRQPDNDLVLDDPSVSKKHAVLRWDAKAQRCSVRDLGSTNGTFLNASIRLKKETILKNGDILSFGEVQYWFLLTPTLHEKLTQAPARNVGV
ncbi:MAG: FHA domain-containing protein [Myxococcota bacterium]|jgi:hypothetical protein